MLASNALTSLLKEMWPVSALGLFLRHFLEYVRLEREQFGERPDGAGDLAVTMTVPAPPSALEDQRDEMSAAEFRKWLERTGGNGPGPDSPPILRPS